MWESENVKIQQFFSPVFPSQVPVPTRGKAWGFLSFVDFGAG